MLQKVFRVFMKALDLVFDVIVIFVNLRVAFLGLVDTACWANPGLRPNEVIYMTSS